MKVGMRERQPVGRRQVVSFTDMSLPGPLVLHDKNVSRSNYAVNISPDALTSCPE